LFPCWFIVRERGRPEDGINAMEDGAKHLLGHDGLGEADEIIYVDVCICKWVLVAVKRGGVKNIRVELWFARHTIFLQRGQVMRWEGRVWATP